MSPELVAGLAVVLLIIYVVLPVVIGALAVNLGLRTVKGRQITFGAALGVVVGCGVLTRVATGILEASMPSASAPWVAMLGGMILGGVVFVTLLRRSSSLTVPKAIGVWGATIAVMLIFGLLVILPLRLFVMAPYMASGNSMSPTLPDRSLVLVDKLSVRVHGPERGDIVILRPPSDPTVYYIERVIGLPGERVAIADGRIVITSSQIPQGWALSEPYIAEGAQSESMSWEERALHDDEYFVLGDNREHASDSRSWGAVVRGNIVGKVAVTLTPFDRAGVIERPRYGAAKSSELRREVERIESAQLTVTEIELLGASSESGVLRAYHEGDVLRKLVVDLYFEGGRTVTAYYLSASGEPFHLMETRLVYEEPLPSLPARIIESRTESVYLVGDERLIEGTKGETLLVSLPGDRNYIRQHLMDVERYKALALAT